MSIKRIVSSIDYIVVHRLMIKKSILKFIEGHALVHLIMASVRGLDEASKLFENFSSG